MARELTREEKAAMAAALQYLREHGLTDYESMAASTEAAVEHFHALAGKLRETEGGPRKDIRAYGGHGGLCQDPACI